MTDLEDLGWDASLADAFQEHARAGLLPGRVALGHRGVYVLLTAEGELRGALAGRLRHEAARAADLPAVGDWVALRPSATDGPAAIHAVLPRSSAFSRKVAGETTDEQVVAANVDTLFLVSGLDREFNPRRIERSLVLARESGALAVLLLNKADACADPEARAEEARHVAAGVAVHVVSARLGTGLEALATYLRRGQTVALVGSSGVGKSTLVNRLLGREAQATREVRARDGRGQHVTTRREVILLPGGSLLIDTPGWRELQLWAEGAGLDQAFEDVAALAARCRFRDCAQARSPGARSAKDCPTTGCGATTSSRASSALWRRARMRGPGPRRRAACARSTSWPGVSGRGSERARHATSLTVWYRLPNIEEEQELR